MTRSNLSSKNNHFYCTHDLRVRSLRLFSMTVLIQNLSCSRMWLGLSCFVNGLYGQDYTPGWQFLLADSWVLELSIRRNICLMPFLRVSGSQMSYCSLHSQRVPQEEAGGSYESFSTQLQCHTAVYHLQPNGFEQYDSRVERKQYKPWRSTWRSVKKIVRQLHNHRKCLFYVIISVKFLT